MARPFGSPGSLTVNTPSLLERRQAISDMAAINNRESSLARRLFRQYSQASRKGDTEAGEKAMDLFDRSRERGIELGGIQSYDQRMNAAGQDLSQRIQTNQELADMESGAPQAAPASSGAMTLTAQGWTPNETLATDPVQAQEGIVGGPSGIDATPVRSGPSPAEGGIMAARNRSVSPIYSSRGIEQQTAPQSLDPNYGPPVGSASTPDREFAKKFPALSAFMQRAGEVDYTIKAPGHTFLSKEQIDSITPGTFEGSDPEAVRLYAENRAAMDVREGIESEVASYRFDESLYPEEKKRRMAKRAREKAGLPPNAAPPASAPASSAAPSTPNPSPTPAQRRNVVDMSPRIPVPRAMSSLSQVMGMAPETLDVTLGRASRAIDLVAGSPKNASSGLSYLAKKAHERVISTAYDTGLRARRKVDQLRKGASNLSKAARSDLNL